MGFSAGENRSHKWISYLANLRAWVTPLCTLYLQVLLWFSYTILPQLVDLTTSPKSYFILDCYKFCSKFLKEIFKLEKDNIKRIGILKPEGSWETHFLPKWFLGEMLKPKFKMSIKITPFLPFPHLLVTAGFWEEENKILQYTKYILIFVSLVIFRHNNVVF